MSVINRPQQQVLSLCLLLTANYDALQVCPTNHTCNQQLIQYQSLFLSTPSPLLSLQYTSSTFRGVCLLSDTHTHTHMEMLLGQPPPVAVTQCTSSVTPHLEPPEGQQGQEDGEK